ncbi:kinase-like protein, partial [Saccharata proteae CBS 121410]
MTRNLAEGQHLTGESGSSYLVVSPMFRRKPGAPVPNVWSAVDSASQEDVFIMKQPGGDELAANANANAGAGWPRFQSEMIMHELFKSNPHIRQQVDRIPPGTGHGDEPPRIVLEPTETTLWSARAKRPFTDDEIRVVMKGALLGLRGIHEKGLVYADLKPDNIFVNGFRRTADETTAENSLNAVIGDLGLVMEPAVGKVQPLVYRSPEVHFKSSITPAADLWSWGMIYTHLLQAQVQPARPGLYDLQDGASAIQVEQTIRRFITDDFDLHNVPYYSDCILPSGHSRAEPE